MRSAGCNAIARPVFGMTKSHQAPKFCQAIYGTQHRIVLISLSRNRLPDFCPAAALELHDPWWQTFLSYASQVLVSRHQSLVDGPPSVGRMVQVRGQS